ncbi:hypothetical protein AA18889_0098 [Acetobacter senegalensis DSM 18889]|nr:hypothetical protein AA18889_0098 [Acetobacter senegalensis DSM 18889]
MAGNQPFPLFPASIQRMNNNGSFTLYQPFSHLHKSTCSLTSSASQPYKFTHPPEQPRFYTGHYIFRHLNLLACGA